MANGRGVAMKFTGEFTLVLFAGAHTTPPGVGGSAQAVVVLPVRDNVTVCRTKSAAVQSQKNAQSQIVTGCVISTRCRETV